MRPQTLAIIPQFATTAICALFAQCAFAGATDAITPPDPRTESPTTLSPPILVEAPEPRYVAPTLRDRIGRIWAPVMINGKGPFRLVLDTGANSSAIIQSVSNELGIPPHETKRVQLSGVTGTSVVPVIDVDSLEVGDLLIDGATLPIVADVFGGAEGILAGNGLKNKRVFIDFHHDLIRITQSKGQSLPLGFTRVPLTISPHQLLTFDILIGNVRTKAILDTGGQQTIGNNSLRNALLRRAAATTDQSIIGVTLDVAHGKSVMVPPIGIGGIEVRNMRVTFGDMFIFEKWNMTHQPTILIGMDVIGSLDTMIIDYKLRELQIRARNW